MYMSRAAGAWRFTQLVSAECRDAWRRRHAAAEEATPPGSKCLKRLRESALRCGACAETFEAAPPGGQPSALGGSEAVAAAGGAAAPLAAAPLAEAERQKEEERCCDGGNEKRSRGSVRCREATALAGEASAWPVSLVPWPRSPVPGR